MKRASLEQQRAVLGTKAACVIGWVCLFHVADRKLGSVKENAKPSDISCHLLPSINNKGQDAEQALSIECLSIVTHTIDCFLRDLCSMNLKSFLKPKPYQ